jgi:hypothetical protein
MIVLFGRAWASSGPRRRYTHPRLGASQGGTEDDNGRTKDVSKEVSNGFSRLRRTHKDPLGVLAGASTLARFALSWARGEFLVGWQRSLNAAALGTVQALDTVTIASFMHDNAPMHKMEGSRLTRPLHPTDEPGILPSTICWPYAMHWAVASSSVAYRPVE